jgi:hypothetical protein
MRSKVQTDFLFARPSFLSGLARCLDLFGVFDSYNSSHTAAEADERALASDWIITGQDLHAAMHQIDSELLNRQP